VIRATVIADSIGPRGSRLTTFELVAPKRIVAQFNTHGMIRRDSASIRAVPTRKIIAQVAGEPYLPPQWRYRASEGGMQPGGPMSPDDARQMDRIEIEMRDAVLEGVAKMERLKASKEDINAYLEPWMWTTIVATATEWDNYWRQRDHGDAQAAHGILAHAMREALTASTPVLRDPLATSQEVDLWHLPYVTEDERRDLDWRDLPYVSAARCAGVSYFRQGARADRSIADEIARTVDLVRKCHWSPTEMPCRVDPLDMWQGAYLGWTPLRKFYGGESGSTHHGTQRDAAWWVLR
jgi:hypothetical protein